MFETDIRTFEQHIRKTVTFEPNQNSLTFTKVTTMSHWTASLSSQSNDHQLIARYDKGMIETGRHYE